MSTFKCPECGFVQSYMTLRAADGAVGDRVLTAAPDACPNDGAKLLPYAADETDEGTVQ
jgi:hypothetical protein